MNRSFTVLKHQCFCSPIWSHAATKADNRAAFSGVYPSFLTNT